jgi:hypothetical protein
MSIPNIIFRVSTTPLDNCCGKLSIYFAVRGGRGCCEISAADRCKLVRLILLLSLVTGWSVVVQGVLMSIADAWHANPAAPFESCPNELSPAYPPRY